MPSPYIYKTIRTGPLATFYCSDGNWLPFPDIGLGPYSFVPHPYEWFTFNIICYNLTEVYPPKNSLSRSRNIF
jgi:hypothetical protein